MAGAAEDDAANAPPWWTAVVDRRGGPPWWTAEVTAHDLPALRRMELDYPWFDVIPATSDERAAGVAPGTIPVLGAKASWEDRDIYISGLDAMIVAAVRGLPTLGADPALLHYDLQAETAWQL